MPKVKRPKRVNYTLIPQGEEPYKILAKVVKQWHPHLKDAAIALAWRRGLKRDKDGLMVLGKAKKASDLDKELKPFDFCIILNEEMWGTLNAEKRAALIDHEACHCQVSIDDETGEPKRDERGRTIWRLRKHSIEEFEEIPQRHGLYKKDLERFARICLEQKKTPLFPKDGDKPKMGVVG
jgi:hypothetical protein